MNESSGWNNDLVQFWALYGLVPKDSRIYINGARFSFILNYSGRRCRLDAARANVPKLDFDKSKIKILIFMDI